MLLRLSSSHLAPVVGALALLAQSLAAQVSTTAAPARLEIRRDSAPPVVMTTAELARLPRTELHAVEHGRSGTFAGVPLATVLRQAGVPIDSVRGRRTAAVVIITAADGYRAAFSLAELAPDLGGRAVLVADRRDGEPLGATEGPLRLVVPDDKRPTRWVRQVVRIDVRQVSP
jgi:DMSO/TMAO reductase YedYZ molybdopterin-dependent catalytic subunit